MKPRRKHLRQSQVYAMCQVRRGWISLNNKLYKRKWPLIWVFLMKTQLTMRYLLRGKPSSNAYLGIKSVKRVKRETAPSSESAQCILAWRSEDSVEKREKQPRRGPARQWQQRNSRSGTKMATAKCPAQGQYPKIH